MGIRKTGNRNGPVLTYSEESGKGILEKDGLFFKDLTGDGRLYPYEDWRLSPEERARDLASRLSVQEIAGLMLHSGQQMLPGYHTAYLGGATYEGKEYKDSSLPVYACTDQQKRYVTEYGMRYFLLSKVPDAESAARWVNQMQEMAEKSSFGIPVSISSDPRHGTTATDEFNSAAGGKISHWPENIGIAATFSPELAAEYGEAVASEYRAMGITTALSPQIDLATEPRWVRFSGTFGESSALAADMAQEFCDGLQGKDGWGTGSVAAMAKHWPGGGAVEAGRDAHFPCGKYSVYPGGNFEEHLIPFTKGAFALKGKTLKAASVMPYYTIPVGQDRENGENVGCSYNKYLITTLLREKYGYDELVCTDWGITENMGPMDMLIGGKCWGVELVAQAERCYKILMEGADQFGGLMVKEPVMKAYELGVKEHGAEWMRQRFETSAVRILKNLFRLGLFENPYVETEEANEICGNVYACQKGFEAQVKSAVLLKNKDNCLPLDGRKKVYIPKQYTPGGIDWMMRQVPEKWENPVPKSTVERYFQIVEKPEEADAAICCMRMPKSNSSGMDTGYSREDKESGGSGYVPITRQYRPYTAKGARRVSLAGGDPREDFINRSYYGKTATAYCEKDLDVLIETKKAMGGKPVIACVDAEGPMVVSEFEPYADAVLMSFHISWNAVLTLLSGREEPSGLLPFQMPSSMDAMEKQLEDVPLDMESYVDSEGNTYDFAYGRDWKGQIRDERVLKYGMRQEMF